MIAKNNLISRYIKKEDNCGMIKVNDKENYDNIMKQLDEFDLKFEKSYDKINEEHNLTENKFMNDDLTATAFFKNVKK